MQIELATGILYKNHTYIVIIDKVLINKNVVWSLYVVTIVKSSNKRVICVSTATMKSSVASYRHHIPVIMMSSATQ